MELNAIAHDNEVVWINVDEHNILSECEGNLIFLSEKSSREEGFQTRVCSLKFSEEKVSKTVHIYRI